MTSLKRDRVTLTAECKNCGVWHIGYRLHDDNVREKILQLSTCCPCGRMLARWQEMDDGGWALCITRKDGGHPSSVPWPSRTPKQR